MIENCLKSRPRPWNIPIKEFILSKVTGVQGAALSSIDNFTGAF